MATAKDRLPASVSIEDMARRRKLKAAQQPGGTRQMDEGQLALLRQSLNASVPDNMDQLVEGESQMTLPVMEILHYDKNPRKAPNEDYDAIKASIRETKRLNSPLVVTRRPGEEKFMVGHGGNTRLSVLQELFTETSDRAFQYTVVTFVPWISESATLAAHLVENELRAEMCFWDKANAYADMKRLIEAENNTTLSGRAFEQALKERGLPVGKTTLSYFGFAVNNLQTLGGACSALSKQKVQEIQPQFNAFERLLKHALQAETWPGLRNQVLKSVEQSWLATGDLDPVKIIDQLDQAVALKLGEAVEFVRTARDLCQKFQNEDVAGLVAQARLQMKPAALPHVTTPATVHAPTEAHPKVAKGDGEGKSPRAKASSTPASMVDLITSAQELATRFARMSEVADCLHLMDTWPTGFYMEVPERDEPIDLSENGADRYHGWWMLAMLSDQLDDTWSDLMPMESTWRQAQRQENGRDEYALQHYMDTILGMPIDPLTLGKRLASELESVTVWMELVQTLRDLRVHAPERFRGGAL